MLKGIPFTASFTVTSAVSFTVSFTVILYIFFISDKSDKNTVIKVDRKEFIKVFIREVPVFFITVNLGFLSLVDGWIGFRLMDGWS